LDSKRFIFSRFYFLSDEYLLAILGSSDPEAVQPHMLKLFDNCKELVMSKSKQVLGMESDENETFDFRDIVKPDDNPVEIWMTKVDLEMKKTLHRIMKEATFKYGNQERIAWALENIGMIAIAGTQIWWTWRVEDVFDKVRGGNKYAMKQ
jgi:dynein heavy chain